MNSNNRYGNEVILLLGIFMLVFFSILLPAWQFFSYDIHCDRLEDKCIVKETITGLTVKTFKISETKGLVVKSFYIPGKVRNTEVKYVSLEKKDGKFSFARGLLAEEKDKTAIDKFNAFIGSVDENTYDYTNKNIEFKISARIFIVAVLIFSVVIPLFSSSEEYIYDQETGARGVFSIWNILVVLIYILLFTVAFNTSDEAQKIKKEVRQAAREASEKSMHISSCSNIYELYPPGKMHVWLEVDGKIMYTFDAKNMTGEKLKELYKIDQHNYLKDGTKRIIEEGENTLTVRTQYNTGNFITPACIHKWTFYAKNECLNKGECYVEVRPYSEYYPDSVGTVKKFEFIFDPEHIDRYYVTMKARRID